VTRKRIYTAIPKYLIFAHDHILQFVLANDGAPLTPYSGPFWLLDTVDREAIRESNELYIEAADEIWVFGVDKPDLFEGWEVNNLSVTDGVVEEIKTAKEQDIPVKLHHVEVDSQLIMTRGYLDDQEELSISNRSAEPNLY
jgi:hypothetical protein